MDTETTNKSTERLHIVVQPKFKRWLFATAEQMGMSVTEFTKAAMREYARQHLQQDNSSLTTAKKGNAE